MNTEPSDQRQHKAISDEQLREHREDLLDQALEESFPASDPPSIARPHIGKAKS